MEDIEYLEEYEDLVLPALNSAAAAAAAASSVSYQTNKNPQNQKINEVADDSSSSLDQDIFNCLFDDNSDDDDYEYENSVNERTLKIKSRANEYFEAIDEKSNEIEGKVIEKVNISRQDTGNKSPATAQKPKTCMTKTSGTTIPLNTKPQTAFVNKTKSVATVRPTVQNQQHQNILNTKSNLLQKSTSSFTQRQNPSTSAASKSFIGTKPSTTIVKPEKITTTDPTQDPLDLDDLSEAASVNASISDISGETYNSFSDFEEEQSNYEYYSGDEDYYEELDDEECISGTSQVIELSNDSSSAPSNLEDLRAPTPSPVISDDSKTVSSSSSFKISTIKSVKPYSHPDIIESVLRKGEKPKLLELLQKYNLLEESAETGEGDNTVIDITTSRENLVESLDTQQAATLTNIPPPTSIIIDLVNLDLTDNNKPLTLNPLSNNETKSSKKTNKKKSKKKSVINMDTTSDCRDLQSPSDVSTDSDLSAVEELLEESYAEAMKRVQNVPFTNQYVAIREEATSVIENKQNLPKTGVVIDYDAEKNKTIEQTDGEQKQIEIEIKEVDQKNMEVNASETMVEKETKDKKEINEVEINKLTEQTDCPLKLEVVGKENPENVADKDLKTADDKCQKTINIPETVDSNIFDSPNAKKKKRFRNLITPEPSTSETGISIDDMKDFKGFGDEEDVKFSKSTETQKKTIQPTENTQEKKLKNTAEKDLASGSFKSPSRSNQSLKDKPRESKSNSSRADSKESKDKSSGQSKTFRGGSKDRSSSESSRDKPSRESSKDRSRESSKDRSKQSHNKDSASKHHHRDHRKSSDSKDSSKSRESSKSRDSKETKSIKTETQHSHKSTSIKTNLSPDSNREKSTAKKDKTKETVKSSADTKITKEQDIKKVKSSSDSSKSGDSKETKNIKTGTQESHKSSSIKKVVALESNTEKPNDKKDNNSKEVVKSSSESKITKVQENKTQLTEVKKTSSENKDKSPAETVQYPKGNNSGKTLSTSTKESKETHKSSISSAKTDPAIIHVSSKEPKNIKKIVLTKSSSETVLKSDHSKSPKVSKDLNKSVTKKPSTSTTVGNVTLSKTNNKPTHSSKSVQENKSDQTLQKSNVSAENSKSIKNITKSASDKSLNLKDTLDKKTVQSPKTSSNNLNTSKTFSKTVEGDKKSPQKNIGPSSSVSKKDKTDGQTKKTTVDLNKTVNEKQQSNKIPTKSDLTNKTPVKQLPKETVGSASKTKQPEPSSVKPGNAETKNTNVSKSTSENVQKPKTIAESGEMKTKEKTSSDFKKPSESLKSSKEAEQIKTLEIKNKNTNKTSMSPKGSPKPKVETIKKTDASNVNNAAKQKVDSKNFGENTAQKSATIKGETKTKADGNKIKDSKNAVDSTSGSEKKTNEGKNEVAKSKNDVNETKKIFSSANKQENQATADTEQVKETKIDKDESKETSLKTEGTNDVEIEKKDVSIKPEAKKDIVPEISQKEKVLGKNKIPETSNKEQKETVKSTVTNTPSEEEKVPKTNHIPETPNNEQKDNEMEKNKTPEISNREEKKIEENKTTQTTNNAEKLKDMEKTKKPQTLNKEQKGKKISKNKIPQTPNKEQKETESNKIPEDRNKEQKVKEMGKSKISETPNTDQKPKESLKTKVPQIPNNEQIVKEMEKTIIQETSNKEQKEADTLKNTVPQTPNKDEIGKESTINKIVETPNKEQLKTDKEKPHTSKIVEEKREKGAENNKIPQIPSKEQKDKEVEKNKVPETPIEELREVETEKNEVPQTSNKIQSRKVVEKNKKLGILNKEQKISTLGNIDANKSVNISDQNKTKTETQITTNKDKLNERKTTKKSEVPTNKSKTIKKLQKRHETIFDNPIEKKEEVKNPQETSEEANIKEISALQEEKMEAKIHQASCVESIINPESNKKEEFNVSLKPIKPQDVIEDTAIKDVIMVDEKQDQIKTNESQETLNEETEQNEGSDKNLEKVKATLASEIILKDREKPVLRKTFKDEAAEESEKIRSIMESVLEKSVVIVIEPLKSIPIISRNKENETAIELGKSGESAALEKNYENENEKIEVENDTGLKEMSDICQTSNLTKDSEALEDEKSIETDGSKIEIHKEIVESIKTRSEDVESLESKSKETQMEVSHLGLSDEIKSIENKTEDENGKPIKAGSHGDPEKEKCETVQAKSCEEKCSTLTEEKEIIETLVTGNSQEKPILEALGDNSLAKIKSKEDNIEPTKTLSAVEEASVIESTTGKISLQKETDDHFEPIKTRKRGEFKAETEKDKSKLTQGELSDETSSAKTENEPIKTRSRGDLKEEATKGITEILELKEEHFQSVKTKSRGDLKADTEKTETMQVELSEEISLTKEKNEPVKTRRRCDLKESSKDKLEIIQVEHLESVKTRRRADLKTEAEEKMSTKKECEPVKTRARSDLKEENVKENQEILQVDSVGDKCSAQNKLKEDLKLVKTRTRGDPKAETETTQLELAEEKSSDKKEKEPLKTSRRGDLKEAVEKKTNALEIELLDPKCSDQNELKGEQLESAKKRKRGDLNVTIETVNIELSEDKNSSGKNENDPAKTRRRKALKEKSRRGDLKAETDKDKIKIIQAESSDDKGSTKDDNELVATRESGDLKLETKKELNEEHLESMKTKRNSDLEVEGSEEITQITPVELSVLKCSDKKEFESIKTRSRSELKEEILKNKAEILEVVALDDKCSAEKEMKEDLETVKRGKHGDLKLEEDREEKIKTKITEKNSSNKNENESAKTKRLCDLLDEALKEKKQIPKDDIIDDKCSAQKELEEEYFEPPRTRSRVDLQSQPEKETPQVLIAETLCGKTSMQKDSVKGRSTPKKTRAAVKEKSEISSSDNSLSNKTTSEENTEKLITETQLELSDKEDAANGRNETSQVEEKHFETITTRSRVNAKAEHVKDKSDISKVEPSEIKCFVHENSNDAKEEHFEPRRTRSRMDVKGETENKNNEISLDSLDINLSVRKSTKENANKNKREENVTPIKIASLFKDDKEQMPSDVSQNPTCEKPTKTRSCGEDVKKAATNSEGNIEPKILQDEETFSTADEKKSGESCSIVPCNDGKQLQPLTALTTKSESDKIFEETFSSENEMSGCESSSSNSEITFRRTLRKRATDSPLPENDKKKTFKEPLVKSAIFVTPKSVKNEKSITNVLSSSTKRSLRSPAVDPESSSYSKKPKLDISNKSPRPRILHDDCLEKTVVAAETTSKEQQHLVQQPVILDKQLLKESSTTVPKTTENKNTNEDKDTSKPISILEKKVEEKVKDSTATQASANVIEKKVEKETSKQLDDVECLERSKKSNLIVNKTNKDEKLKNVPNIPVSTIKPKTNKVNVKTTPPDASASPSAVISFTDWLKIKNQNITEGTNDAVPTEESTPDISNRQSGEQASLTSNVVESKLLKEKELAVDTDKASQVVTLDVMMCQEKAEVQNLEESQENNSVLEKTYTSGVIEESMDISQQLDSSLLQLSENQLQKNTKQQSVKKNKKVNIKRLQTSNKVSKTQLSSTKSNTPTITPPRAKRSETDLLIQSMPKEMKDRGITDLLNTEAHIKRQRLPNRRIVNDIIEPQKPAATSPATITRAAKDKNVPNVSENLEAETNTSTSKDISKSPTRRKPQQNVSKSRKSIAVTQRESSRRDIANTQDLTASIDHDVLQKEPKTISTKSRRPINVKNLPRQGDTDFPISDIVRSRKSMPILSKESFGNVINVSSRKSLAVGKQQPAKEQIELSESHIFKTPKQEGPSAILNKIPIPSAASIKKLYASDIKRPESRIQIQQNENVIKKFKCRKPYVRLDRSIVENYFKSISNKEQQRVAKKYGDITPIIQNNSETSLRIQSVLDASSILNTDTQAIQRQFSFQNLRDTLTPLTTPIINAADTNEIIELKHEFMDENPIGLINDAILPDTPTLLARAQTITEAAQHALSNSVTPTDIRLLTTDSTENNFVPSFGVTPRSLDNKGTCLYTFLHPAKYNRNHSNVLLDYCCPNLDGPMPAIDPTRIHAQVQTPTIELPASIVLTTKVVTRADLENGSASIPSIIRKKAEKIRKNMATHHKMAVATTAINSQTTPMVSPMTQPHIAPAQTPSLSPTINALTKQLPSTTTITAKMRTPISQQSQMVHTQLSSINVASGATTLPKTNTVSVIPKIRSLQLSDTQQAALRSNLRRFDVLLKQLVQPYESLSFVERHRIIESVIASGSCLPKDLDHTLVIMEEYIRQTMLLKRNESLKQPSAPSTSAIMSTNNYTTSQPAIVGPLPTAQMPQLQPSPKILASNAAPVTANTYSAQFEKLHNKVQAKGKNTSSTSATTSSGSLGKQRQVPIYDTDRNIIGYQMQMMANMSTMPAYTKSTMSTTSSGIMSSSLDSSSNNIPAYCISKRPMKRPAQDSPRVFYTTPPLQTSTPKGNTNSDMYSKQQAKYSNTIAHKTKGSVVTTVRSAGSSSSSRSERITTTTMATVKRVTRSTATGSKIIILSKSNQSSEETILPDSNNSQQQTDQPEIKNEKDTEDFLG